MSGCRHTPDHAKKERRHLGGETKAGEFPNEIGERILKHIEGRVLVAGEAVGQSVDPIAITIVQGLERIVVAGVDGFYQLLV